GEIELVEPGALVERAKRALAKAVASEIDAVMVGGGDGSIRCVAEVLAATGVPLAVLPLGTLNHFAKDLGVPLDVNGAVAVVAQGETRKVDIGEVNGRVFLNTSSIGIYPYMVLDRERLRKTGLSKWSAMGMAALHALQHLPRRRLRIA